MVAVCLCLPVATWEFLTCLFSLTLAVASVFWAADNNAIDGAGRETSIKVEMKRLDYGDTACLSLWNTKELTPEMATLPLQAIQVSLANVSGSLLTMLTSYFLHMYVAYHTKLSLKSTSGFSPTDVQIIPLRICIHGNG